MSITTTTTTTTHHRVGMDTYAVALGAARTLSALVHDATSSPHEIVSGGMARYYLSDDGQSGYAVRDTGELVGVFSLVKGRGDAIVSDAIDAGARHLDCFDGYLPSLYGRHGFHETNREPNWTAGEPDVVFMAR